MRRVLAWTALGLAGAVLAGRPVARAADEKLSDSDHKFLRKAARDNWMEIVLGREALANTKDPAVRQFARRMLDDHTRAYEKLARLAREKGITLPRKLSDKDQAEIQRLSRLKGEQFDRVYARDMRKDHEKDVARFKAEIREVKDPALKKWAEETLPVLEEHLKLAHRLFRKEK